MKFSLRLQTHRVDLGDEFISTEGIGSMARAAEESGFDSVNLTHHWIPHDDWLADQGIHPLDPFAALAVAGAATTRLRLMTNVIVLPYQNPFITAKSAATVDAMSGGRLILGCGAGFQDREFEALGVDMEERNELTDESLRGMKAAWSGDSFDFDGRHFKVRSHTMLPRPAQRPHPPIWIGGNSKRAARRAVDLADGWIPIPIQMKRTRTPFIVTLEDLRTRIGYTMDYAASVGRKEPLTICFAAGGLDFRYGRNFDTGPFLERVHTLEEMGVSYMTCHLPSDSRSEYQENAARFSESVLRHAGG